MVKWNAQKKFNNSPRKIPMVLLRCEQSEAFFGIAKQSIGKTVTLCSPTLH